MNTDSTGTDGNASEVGSSAEKRPLPEVVGGPLRLLTSPLFVVVFGLAGVLGILVGLVLRSPIMGLLASYAATLLAAVVIWSYLALRGRLRSLAEQTDHLLRLVERATEQAQRAADDSDASGHIFTHQLMTALSADQGRLLQSSEEVKRAVAALAQVLDSDGSEVSTVLEECRSLLVEIQQGLQEHERLNEALGMRVGEEVVRVRESVSAEVRDAYARADDESRIARERFDHLRGVVEALSTELVTGLTSSLDESLEATRDTIDSTMSRNLDMSLDNLQRTLLQRLSDQTAAQVEVGLERAADLSSAVKSVREGLSALKDHIDQRLTQLQGQGDPTPEALQVSTALDRLNLEVRRQLAEVRHRLNSADKKHP